MSLPRQHPDIPRRQVTTQLLRISTLDWAAIANGSKRELRTQGRYALLHGRVNAPWPVLGYMYPRWDEHPKTMLLVIEEAWSEPLGTISHASIEREGFASLDEFRSYWRARYRAGYKPLSTVQVARLHVMTTDEQDTMAHRLLSHLYGTWL